MTESAALAGGRDLAASPRSRRLSWQAVGASVRGSTHRRQGLPAQDAIEWRGTPRALVLAVADGHGSAGSPRSDVGARLAAGVATALLGEYADAAPPLDDERLARELVARWRSAVLAHVARHPFAPPLSAPSDEAQALLRYGTTIVTALVTADCLLFCQLGDGDILLVSPPGKVTRPWGRDRRLLGGETTSLCQPNAWREVRLARRSLTGDDAEAPALILLSTDGYANSFRTERGFLRVGRDLLQLVQSQGLDPVRRDLETWLNETSEQGSGDDITVGLLYRAPNASGAPDASVEAQA